MSTNLTYKHKIVKDLGGELSYPRGYDLVIQEKGAYRIMQEGIQEKKSALSFLGRKKDRKVFAVSNDSNHTFPLKKIVNHNDRVHYFHAVINFKYKVGSPKSAKELLIRKLNSDPLLKIKNEVSSLICGRLKSEEWQTLIDPAKVAALQDRILRSELVKVGLDEGSSLIERVNLIAGDYGLEVTEVFFNTEIPEEFLSKETALLDSETEIEVKKIKTDQNLKTNKLDHLLNIQQKDLDEEIRQKDRLGKLKDTAADTLAQGINVAGSQIASGIRDMGDLNEVLRQGTETIGMLGATGSINNPNASLGSGNNGTSLLGTGNKGNLVSVIYEILKEMKAAKLSSKKDEKNALSAIFYLVADTLSGEDQEKSQTLFISRIGEIEFPQGLRNLLKAQWEEIKDHIENDNLL